MTKTISFGALVLALALPATAQAAIIDLSGTVTSGGVGIADPVDPFEIGDQLTGFIQISDSAADAGSNFGLSDLIDFQVTVGAVSFSLANAMPFGFFNGQVSADGMSLSQLNVSTNFGSYPGCGTCNLLLNAGADSFVVTVLSPSTGFAEGSDLTTSFRVEDVPEPSMIALFGLGVAAAASAARRRRNTRK